MSPVRIFMIPRQANKHLIQLWTSENCLGFELRPSLWNYQVTD